jgi:hypothetical protein
MCEPETLAVVEPDVHLVAALLSLNRSMPNKTRQRPQGGGDSGRLLERKLDAPMHQAVSSSLNRAARDLRPRHQDINCLRTIRAKRRHCELAYRTIISETRIGFGA